MITATERHDGAVLHVLLDRPKANVLDAEMISGIMGALDRHIYRETRLVVFEGSGSHFCFGASVAEHQRAQVPAMLEAFHGLFLRLAELAVPTAAVVRGLCLGGGLELASWCTWIVAEPSARLGQPEIALAVFPPMASILLPWRIGGGAAAELCLSGRQIDAAEALRMGLVTAVVEDADPWLERLITERLLPRSATSLRMAERAVRGDLMSRMHQQLPALERLYLEELMATEDANEGIAAFLERRKPRFTHGLEIS